MTTQLLVFVIAVSLTGLVSLTWWWKQRRRQNTYPLAIWKRTTVGLRRVHLRLEVTAFRHAVRRDAVLLRRELHRELSNIDRKGET